MQRACDSCGQPYEAKRATSQFCSSRCRQRNARSPEKPPEPSRLVTAGEEPLPALIEATMRELDALGVLDTTRGQQALQLAYRMGSGADTGSSIAAVSKEFRAVMDEIRSEQPAKRSLVDELRARRERKLAAG